MVDIVIAFSVIVSTFIMLVSFIGLFAEKRDYLLRARMGMSFKISSFIVVAFIIFNALFR